MCARVLPHAGPLEDAHADAREDWLELRARIPAIRANSFEREFFDRRDSTRLERKTDARLAPRRRRVKRTRTN